MVPTKDKYKGLTIGRWSRDQRIAFNRDELSKGTKLSKERSDLLEQTFPDWTWDPLEDKWKNYLEALKEYYKEFGTSLVPTKVIYKGLNLGEWVSKQRAGFKKDESSEGPKLSKERCNLLEQNIPDWSWDVLENIWMKHFENLKEYYKEFGTSWVSKKVKYKGQNLGKWVGDQRVAFRRDESSKKSKLSKKRIDLLEETFPDWSWNIIEDSWTKYFEALKEYYKEFGTSLIPHKDKYKGLNLGSWVRKQRGQFNSDQSSKLVKLSKEKSDLLEQTFPDWSWDIKGDLWMKNYEALKEYYKEFGTSQIHRSLVYKNLKLGNWVSAQRIAFNRDESSKKLKLSKERIDLLEQTFHDWTWNIQKDLWMKNFKALKEYYKEFGTSHIGVNEKYKDLNLGKWITTQRKEFNKGGLPKERIDLLEETYPDWSWNIKEDSWRKHFEALKEYYKEFGTSIIPARNKYKNIALGNWVFRQRLAFKRDESSKGPKLSKEKSDLLEQTFPDWVWKIK